MYDVATLRSAQVYLGEKGALFPTVTVEVPTKRDNDDALALGARPIQQHYSPRHVTVE